MSLTSRDALKPNLSQTSLTKLKTSALLRRDRTALWPEHGHFHWTLFLTLHLCVYLSQGLLAPCVRSTSMSAPARPARMERSATTGPTGSSAAALKVRASAPSSCQWIIVRSYSAYEVFTGRRAEEQMSLNHLLGCVWSLLRVQCFGGSAISLDVCWPSRLTWGP